MPFPKHTLNFSFRTKPNSIYSLVIIVFLCSSAYFLGAWLHRSGAATTSAAAEFSLHGRCNPSQNSTTTASNDPLSAQLSIDFSTHHAAEDGVATVSEETAISYPPCGVEYSEYTPCEGTKRALQFQRERLIYRERHCQEKADILKCRIPAPYGYKNPPAWPASRDVAWYANVPHKELTVEKAVQNWIIYEGDGRFRFPGGGTMFPHGADAYIDDIGKLINLADGSIRTAIDTGCGVR